MQHILISLVLCGEASYTIINQFLRDHSFHIGDVLNFLFGTADQHALSAIKKEFMDLYENQMKQN